MIVGTTTLFGPTLNSSMTCWVGKTAGSGPLIATVPVDKTGKFQIQAVAAKPDSTGLITGRSSNGGTASPRVNFK